MGNTLDLYEVISHESGRNDQEPAFFYHSDHLGSAAYLTNDAGQVTQTLNYLPYGEDWVDIQNYAETRYPRLGIYSNNGKEKDYESGFHYYGARYYWSELLTGWLSVDPMMDKYSSISSYNYCVWNPIKFIDPDGREWDKPKDKEQARKMEEAVNDRISDISTEIQSKRDKIEKLKTNTKMDLSKRYKKIAALNDELSDLEYQKGLLADFVVGLHDLRDDPDRRYTFNPSEDAFQTNTFQEVNGVIPINYQEVPAIGFANLVHETTHAIQDYRGQMYVGNLMSCERNAYSTQYAYSSDSFKYINNNICPSSRISEAWVRGVYFFKGGEPFYPYMDIK